MTSIEQRLQSIIDNYSLLNHPFYTAWSEGTLAPEKLKQYTREYASFIGTVAEGWLACGDEAIAKEEMEHYEIWKDFSKSLGNESVGASLYEVNQLVDSCHRSYTSYVSSLGALYAFECQQPYTSKSKLEGLRTHYKSLGADETYFEIHENDFEEPAILLKKIEALPKEEQERVAEACAVTCEKLWNALTGIMGSEVTC